MSDTAASLQALRAQVRAWLSAHVPRDWRARQTGGDVRSFVESQQAWLRTLVEAGYATPHWPKGWPGGGRSLAEQVVIFEEIARADAPRMLLHFVSLYHTAMTLVEFGSEAQKARHLPAILRGEVWCQGFSEPGAGSDLAALTTQALRRGDRYVVNGQKIWSTLGHFADFCLLLVRTDTTVAKQAGITFLLMDMKSNGIRVQPIRQITGDEEFAQMFLDDVEIPVENRVGEENQGWRVAQTTLASERGLALVELTERLHGSLWRLGTLLTRDGATIDGIDADVRRAFADIGTRVEALRALIRLVMNARATGTEVPGGASLIKLAYARVSRDFTSLGLRARGIAGQRWEPYTLGAGYETGNWMFDFMNSYQYNIAGGSNEIQRNIIAERVLSLPRENRA